MELTADRPDGYKYSLVYIVEGKRAIGYDNSEGKGDHCHYDKTERPYKFTTLKKLAEDFYDDVAKFKRGENV